MSFKPTVASLILALPVLLSSQCPAQSEPSEPEIVIRIPFGGAVDRLRPAAEYEKAWGLCVSKANIYLYDFWQSRISVYDLDGKHVAAIDVPSEERAEAMAATSEELIILTRRWVTSDEDSLTGWWRYQLQVKPHDGDWRTHPVLAADDSDWRDINIGQARSSVMARACELTVDYSSGDVYLFDHRTQRSLPIKRQGAFLSTEDQNSGLAYGWPVPGAEANPALIEGFLHYVDPATGEPVGDRLEETRTWIQGFSPLGYMLLEHARKLTIVDMEGNVKLVFMIPMVPTKPVIGCRFLVAPDGTTAYELRVFADKTQGIHVLRYTPRKP